MILHENRLPEDDSHEISCLICYSFKSCKSFNCRLLQIIGGALRVKLPTKIHSCSYNAHLDHSYVGPDKFRVLNCKYCLIHQF